tara:strand:- start:62 stop:316 length:255 start_codon:yes stop_codon:yes gene_type:complete
MNTTLFKFTAAWNHNQNTLKRVSNVSQEIGRIVKSKRLKSRMTLEQLSIPLGVTTTTVWNLEQGRKVWTLELATKALEVLEDKP